MLFIKQFHCIQLASLSKCLFSYFARIQKVPNCFNWHQKITRKVYGNQAISWKRSKFVSDLFSNKILNLHAWKKLVLQIVRLQWVKDSSNNLFQNCFTSHFCVFFQKLLHLKALTMKPMLFTCWKMEVSRCVLHCSN